MLVSRMTGAPNPFAGLDEMLAEGLGLALIKSEGEPTPWGSSHTARRKPWPVRVTERPRRKIARALERLADWICRDRDEGW
jgi:hypothetical protein